MSDAIRTLPIIPAGSFRQIGWAFLFIGITVGPNVRRGNESFLIDLLPDFIGYLLIALACDRLIVLDSRARRIRNLALLLTYLSMPTLVQYTVVTSEAGHVSTGLAPLWPWMLGTGLLELIVVWMLCGLVADLARRGGDDATAERAGGLRVAYVLFKILLAGALTLAVLSPNPALILGGVIVGVAIGLLLMCLMMGLMRRAERICAARSDQILHDDEKADHTRRGGRIFRMLALGGVIFPIALVIGGIVYYLDWQTARDEESRKTSNSSYFSPARESFYAPLRAGRIDDAYAATTADFRSRVSREEFAERTCRYAAYLKQHEQRNHAASGAGASLGNESLTETAYIEVEKGKMVQVTLTIRRDRDSIFRRRPPDPKVDDFNVEEKAMPGPQWPAVKP